MSQIVIGGEAVRVDFQASTALMARLKTRRRRSEAIQAILHHDACISALRCFAVLQARGLSTHFCIDNDGTVFQFADPALEVAYHAGRFNGRSIGIDISNAVLTRFADRYDPRREQATLPVHGRPVTGLLPYPCQIEAALALLRVLRQHFPGIANDHRSEARFFEDVAPETPGIFGHLQVTRGKIDPFGFPFERLVEA